MGAQGYQESQLNQNAKNPVGAIGVMQVMLAVGKELQVGDITETEANIHAGIKYKRWMIDQYYEKEPMSKLDKVLFAFASYNEESLQPWLGPDLPLVSHIPTTIPERLAYAGTQSGRAGLRNGRC